MTLRLDDETHERLARLAKSTERSKSFLAMQALYEYLEMNEWQVDQIRSALEAADRAPVGEFVEHGRVAEWLDSWGSQRHARSRGRTGAHL
jgi:predicted transcriptional regulator